METMWLHVRAPFAAFRWFQAGVYRATHPIMPPSSAYGLLLNLGAIDMRDAVAGPTTLIRSDVPLLRIAIGVVTPAELCSLYQQLHTYPVGNASAELKPRTHGAKYHITPVRREVLVGLDCIIGAQSDDGGCGILHTCGGHMHTGRRRRACTLPRRADESAGSSPTSVRTTHLHERHSQSPFLHRVPRLR